MLKLFKDEFQINSIPILFAIKGIKYFKIYFHCVQIGLFLVTPLVPAMLIVTKSWTKDVYVTQQTLEITKTDP